MNHNEIELLAPAGRWEVLEQVAAAGADAIYLGGKRFNMRLLRPGYNFSDQELRDAVNYLHKRNKRLYITVNNIYCDEEIENLCDYLIFLQEIGIDALIIQDIALLALHQQLGLTLPLHISVQMGLSNAKALEFMGAHGVSQVVLSKNLALEEIDLIHRKQPMLLEYFVHGDLCISHTGKCFLSSLMTGDSGNRGLCIKPCRWPYKLKAASEDAAYYLAHKDLCLYPHLKEMVKAGVTSFKIEGRMRDSDYLSFLVSTYRRGLDAVINNREDPAMVKEDTRCLEEKRIRDFSTASLFGCTDVDSVGLSGEREPFFPSSTRCLERLQPEDYREAVAPLEPEKGGQTNFSVKVADLKMLELMMDAGINRIILGYEFIRQYRAGWNKIGIEKALQKANGTSLELIVETPRIIHEADLKQLDELFDWAGRQPLEIMVNELGSLQLALDKGLNVSAGLGLNINNSVAAQFLRGKGLKRLTASMELNFARLETMLQTGDDIELMVQGPLCGLVTDFCFARIGKTEENTCPGFCQEKEFALQDEFGQEYRILSDAHCRNYIYYPYDLCLFAYLPRLYEAGLKNLRIDGQYYDPKQLRQTVSIYRKAVDELQQGKWSQKGNYAELFQLHPGGLTAAPYFRN